MLAYLPPSQDTGEQERREGRRDSMEERESRELLGTNMPGPERRHRREQVEGVDSSVNVFGRAENANYRRLFREGDTAE